MVRIAVAGGTGNVATEILRAPIASGNHDITIFTRSNPTTPTPGVSYKKVDYTDREALTQALKGFEVCLSFLIVHLDPDCIAQKNLIHASIAAGVQRFAPSEWGIKNDNGCPSYANKDIIASYLASLASTGELKQLEYCLFQPSIFMDYFAHGGRKKNPNLITWPFFIDLEHRRAMVLDAGDHPLVLTALHDISSILALALEDARPWPTKLRGGEWSIEQVKGEDIERGVLTASWVPEMSHPVIPDEDRAEFSKEFVVMFFKALVRGAWDVGAEWNERFPDYKFEGLEEFMGEAWRGVP